MRDNLEWAFTVLPASCKDFAENDRVPFFWAKGSTANHQAWDGGYADHLDECFGIARDLYALFSSKRTLPFTLEDVLIVLFLHDVEKIWKHSHGFQSTLHGRLAHLSYGQQALQFIVAHELEIYLTAEHINALENVHGELDNHSKIERVSNELGAFCHICDYWSARGWHNEPRKSGNLD